MRLSTQKKIYIYPIVDTDGTPLDLVNILTYTNEGALDRVDTFIGRHDRDEFVRIAHAGDLSLPGTIFRYSTYVREQESLVLAYLDAYHSNLHGKVYTEDGGSYTVRRSSTPWR